MVGSEQDFETISEKLEKEAKADEIEVRITKSDTALTRYANSQIHQNIGQEDLDVSIRAVFGNKTGAASTNSLELDSLKKCLSTAEKIAKYQEGDPDFKGLPEPKEQQSVKENYVKNTAKFTPDQRAQKVKEIIEMARDEGIDRVYGAFKTESQSLFVANSNGVKKFSRFTSSNLTTTAIADWDDDQGFGWGESCSADVRDIDHIDVGRTAIEKGLNNLDTEKIELGEYDVVLEPLAVQSILMYMDMMGFSAKKVQEERSFMKGKFGEQIMDERVNIYDDISDPEMIGYPFDYEGVPKRRVDIIKNGVANEVVYDSYTAGREEDKESTGHALPMPNPMSPLAMNLLMDTGNYSQEEMIEETNKGILVTRFNYCRPVHPVKGILTGLTRDGTWLIEDGEIKHPLNNLRFTQNLIEAFNNIEGIGEKRKLFAMGFYPAYFAAPALKISDFNFTGTTEF
ncbi:MAG: TldD/PmbA family protein [Candidatus Thermoplasmatota archaeon]|nr:TldD/PmbA family protein [Candidatus Thermoplasmatota archaeon]MBS3790085.1 TldD/PmbA family protein [Candidatus Thermoplasmatota archaeon]